MHSNLKQTCKNVNLYLKKKDKHQIISSGYIYIYIYIYRERERERARERELLRCLKKRELHHHRFWRERENSNHLVEEREDS